MLRIDPWNPFKSRPSIVAPSVFRVCHILERGVLKGSSAMLLISSKGEACLRSGAQNPMLSIVSVVFNTPVGARVHRTKTVNAKTHGAYYRPASASPARTELPRQTAAAEPLEEVPASPRVVRIDGCQFVNRELRSLHLSGDDRPCKADGMHHPHVPRVKPFKGPHLRRIVFVLKMSFTPTGSPGFSDAILFRCSR